ncbi:MAG: Uncharacterized inner membrane protein RarD, partial [uncultured Solirubrobacteraceae bacterium]
GSSAIRVHRGRAGLSPLGPVPALLAVAASRGGGRDPRPSRRVVDRPGGSDPGSDRRLRLGPDAGAPPRRPARARGHPDLGQLGHVHLRRQQRPGGRDVAGLLHQPAGHRGARGRPPRRAAAPSPGGRGGHRGGRRHRAHRRLRPAAVDRPDVGLLLRPLRTGQEARRRRRHPQPGRRDELPGRPCGRLSPVAGCDRRGHLHDGGPEPHRAADGGRDRHRRAADAVRRRGDPGAAHHARAPSVHRADHAVPDRRAGLRRGHAGLAPDRLRAGVAGADHLHRGRRPHHARGDAPQARSRAGRRL